MDFDLSNDPGGVGPLTFKVNGQQYRFENVDVWRLADELSRVFRTNENSKAEIHDEDQLNNALRAAYQKFQVELPAEPWLLPNTLAQRLIAGCREERKKFEKTLWGIGDAAPAWGVFTPDSTPDTAPANVPTA